MLNRFVLLLCIAVAFSGACHSRANSSGEKSRVSTGEIGSRLPSFSATDLDGNRISPADLRGKVVLVDFWTTWCQPCKQEMPGYQTLADKYGPHGFAVIGLKLNTMPDTDDPRSFARKIGVHYPLIVATDELIKKFGGIEGLPTTLLYDRHGVLRKKVIGFEYTKTFEDELKKLL